MRALYLDGRTGLRVRLDGPALRVQRPFHADRFYPLMRISRVIAIGSVRWQPEALVACLKEQKPVAVLDNQGRFVRQLLRRPPAQHGLARHLGELLAVPRFVERYERWYASAEEKQIAAAAQGLDLNGANARPDLSWERICAEQHRRWGIRAGASYRYLLGLVAAHVASTLAPAGLPRASNAWEVQEFGFLRDLLRLERWRQAVLLEEMLERGVAPGRRELTSAFESRSEERESRIGYWRQSVLRAMMGLPEQPEPSACPAEFCERRTRDTASAECGSGRLEKPKSAGFRLQGVA